MTYNNCLVILSLGTSLMQFWSVSCFSKLETMKECRCIRMYRAH